MKKISWLFTISCLFLCSCISTKTNSQFDIQATVVESERRYKKEYILAAGDQLNVVVYRVPNLSGQSIIRPDGYISLPLLDDIQAAGLTVPELDARVTELLSTRLVNPEVTIIVTNPKEPMVYVFGEVARPGPMSLRTTHTAAHAIANAGGMKHSAARDSVAIIRLNPAGKLVAHITEGQFEGQPAYYMALQAMSLQQDDLIIVPESNRAQFVRFINDFINTPMGALNQLLTPYYQFRLLEKID